VKSLLPLAFKAPVKGVPVGILPYCLVCKNQNARCGYSKVVKVWGYVWLFWQNTGMWQTDRWTSCDSIVRAMHSIVQ